MQCTVERSNQTLQLLRDYKTAESRRTMYFLKLKIETLSIQNAPQSMPTSCLAIFNWASPGTSLRWGLWHQHVLEQQRDGSPLQGGPGLAPNLSSKSLSYTKDKSTQLPPRAGNQALPQERRPLFSSLLHLPGALVCVQLFHVLTETHGCWTRGWVSSLCWSWTLY